MISLIDFSKADSNLMLQAERSGWWERVVSLGSETVLWDPEGKSAREGFRVFQNWADLIAYAESKSRRRILLIGIDQLFLDPAICGRGLDRSGDGWDYFTQWEFSRAPVGIGLRALSVRNETVASWAGTPEELIDFINGRPGEFVVRYDSEKYSTYEQSLLDARSSRTLERQFEGATEDVQYDLSGFLKLADSAADELRYSPTGDGPRFDERGMSVPFGFESRACAEFPTYIMFDMSNKCNARCVHCPQGIPAFREAIGKGIFLAEDRIKTVFDQLVGREIDFVRITADGEPLMHPGMIDAIKYANDRGVGPIGLTTNGSLLNEKKIDMLLDSGLFMVDFSLDAIRPETYALVRLGLDYRRVMDNVQNLVKRRDEKGVSLQVIVSFVKQKLNLDEVQEFEDYWSSRVDRVVIREMISNVGINEVDNATNESGKRWPCPHWFRRIVVNYDGRFKACPIDWTGGTANGTVDEDSIFQIWHGDHYWRNRIEHLNNQISRESVCGPCEDWRGTPWDLGYEKIINAMRA